MLAGIDGCPNAWIVITRTDAGALDSHHVSDVEAFLDQLQPKIVAIDIPIGLLKSGARTCDVEARKLLGQRKTSVFPAPILSAIAARDRQAAHDISMSIHGKGVASQSFGIYAKVREVDDLLHARPDLRDRIYEIHPELCFYTWSDSTPMSHPKRTGPGFMERFALVSETFGAEAFDQVRKQHTRRKVADDDILDAFAALWTARRIAAGTALTCPTPPETSRTGFRMAMWH
jgi:predicted RNase H-like nuclease